MFGKQGSRDQVACKLGKLGQAGVGPRQLVDITQENLII